VRKLLFLFITLPFLGLSQNFEYDVLFDGIGDNREFFSEIAMPQTILGTRGAFEVGLSIDEHRIRVGASKLYEFGSTPDFQPTKLILYYQFKNESNEFLMGSFARKDKIDFPLAMLTDTLQYYRPNIEGIYSNIEWSWGYQNVFADWTKRQTDTIRENFTIGFSGEISFNNIFLQNYLILYHDANARIQNPGDHIKDYMGGALQIGIRTSEESQFKAYIKAGILNSNYRERNVSDGFITGNSLFAEVYGKYKKYGLKATLSTGDSHIFAQGDKFYHAKDYLRTDVLWYLFDHENVKGVFTYSFHLLNWNDIDQQQQLSIIYKFGASTPLSKIKQ
jgi:hypothetical protein